MCQPCGIRFFRKIVVRAINSPPWRLWQTCVNCEKAHVHYCFTSNPILSGCIRSIELLHQSFYLAILSQLTICVVSSLYVCMYGHTYSKSMDGPGKVANPTRGQLNRENEHYFPIRVRAPENLASRDEFGSPVPRQPAHLHTQAESGAYLLRGSSRVSRRRLFII